MTPSVQAAVYEIRAISPQVLGELRQRDDAGALPRLLVDEEGGSPLRCCLRRISPGERVALVSYAPLRRWARETGADPGPYDETLGGSLLRVGEASDATSAEALLAGIFDDPAVALVHIRAVEFGCFIFEARRR
jgi:hypothetical protein